MQRMPLHRHLALRRGAALALLAPTLLALAGCGSLLPPSSAASSTKSSARSAQATPPLTQLRAAPGQALLLGEVHDNAAQHALRRDLLAAMLAGGDRPALLLEQFDREHQAALDAASQALAQPSPAALDAQTDAVVRAGNGGPGWHWPFYRPYIRLALAHGLPIVAANVSRAEARRVMQQGLAATGWRADVPADIARAQADAIEASHCGQLKIIELRDRARAALGSRFDIRRFHMAVLDQGAVPLTVLDQQIDAWVAAERQRP